MRIPLYLLGLVIMLSFGGGFFSVGIDTDTNSPQSNEIVINEDAPASPALDASEFAMFWRNVHEEAGEVRSALSAESESKSKEGATKLAWRLVGTAMIGPKETAYLLNADDRLVVVKEGEKFGDDNFVTKINKKSISYTSSADGNLELKLYGIGTELAL